MAGLAVWPARIGPDRMLAIAVAICAILTVAVLYRHAGARMEGVRAEADRRAADQAELIETRMAGALAQLQTLRRRAEFFLQMPPDRADHSRKPLLEAFLASNPGNDPDRPFRLDEPPSPYTRDQFGMIMSMPVSSGGSSSQDPAWQAEAAMALELAPLSSIVLQAVPGIQRLYYASISGLVQVAPWTPGLDTDLVRSYVNQAASHGADLVMHPGRNTRWTLREDVTGDAPVGTASAHDSPLVTVEVPLNYEGRYRGIYGLDISLSALIHLRAGPWAGARMLLVDENGEMLAVSQGDGPLPDIDFARLRPGVFTISSHIVAVRALELGPWRLIHLVPRHAAMLPERGEAVLSLGGLALVLVLVLGLTHRLMARLLRQREAAVCSERQARAAVETALADLRAAHDELDFLNREKTRFFSLISHDLRGPFNTLMGFTGELAEHAPRMPAAEVADFARMTHESARKVYDLLEDLLQWSRVQMSGKPFAPTVFALRELVSAAMRDVMPMASAKDVRILDAVGERWVLADRTMILAVLRNLLVNSVKFSHPDGVIHITSRAMGDRLEVAVTDYGVGMDKAQIDYLFRSGMQEASRPGTQGEKGMGLGLTLVRDLVLRHGGELRVESEPGQGATVTFTVPLAADPDEVRPIPARVAE